MPSNLGNKSVRVVKMLDHVPGRNSAKRGRLETDRAQLALGHFHTIVLPSIHGLAFGEIGSFGLPATPRGAIQNRPLPQPTSSSDWVAAESADFA